MSEFEDRFNQELVDNYDYVLRVSKSVTRRIPSASEEDVAQEAMLKALENKNRFRPESNMRNWLVTIAANAGRDVGRQLSRKPTSSLNIEPEEGQVPLTELVATDDDLDDPLQVTLGHETFARVEAALRKLNPDQHEAVALRLNDFQFNEIAEAAGIPENTAKTRSHRGMEALQGLLTLQELTGVKD